MMAAVSSIFWSISVAGVRQRVYSKTGERMSAEHEARVQKRRAWEREAQWNAQEKAQKRVGLRGLWPW